MILHIFLIIKIIIIVGLPFYPTMYPLCTPYDSLDHVSECSLVLSIGTRYFAYRHKCFSL